MHLARAATLAGKDQLSHRNTARVIAHDERRHGARRHEGARPVHVAHHFCHRLAHVGLRVEDQFHERHTLNVLGLDVLDAGDVEEVILVVVGEIAFHLGGIHAAIGLGNIDGGRAQLRKDVHFHLANRQDRTEGNRHHRDQNRHRPFQCHQYQPHSKLLALLAHFLQKRLQISPRSSQSQQRPPHAQPRQRIFNLRLRQQPLGIGYIHDGRESRLVARPHLCLGGFGSIQLNRRVLRYAPGSFHFGPGSFVLSSQILNHLIEACRLRGGQLFFNFFAVADGREIEKLELCGESNGPVEGVGCEAVEPPQRFAVG